MVWRRVNITRDENIADFEELSRHPNVRKCWKFPWGYTLFEFYDPAFEKVYNADPATSEAARQSEETRAKLATLMLEERKLLQPLYAGRPEHWQGNQFGLPLKTVIYRVVDKTKTRWPWFGASPGWETEKRVKVSGRLKAAPAVAREALEKVFREWVNWATSLAELTRMQPIRYHDRDFSTVCDFRNQCGDACIGLYLLLAKTRRQIYVEAAGFFHPDEKSLRFLEVGGTGILR